MSYERFVELLELSNSLRRALHTCSPKERRTLWKTIDNLNLRLYSCKHYSDYLHRVAFSCDELG